jgi:hypothetical protein
VSTGRRLIDVPRTHGLPLGLRAVTTATPDASEVIASTKSKQLDPVGDELAAGGLAHLAGLGVEAEAAGRARATREARM